MLTLGPIVAMQQWFLIMCKIIIITHGIHTHIHALHKYMKKIHSNACFICKEFPEKLFHHRHVKIEHFCSGES